MTGRAAAGNGFHVARWVDALGGFIERRRGLWIRLGDLETRLFAEELAAVPIERPIYVGGLARSGSTILLEMLAQQDGVVTHRYKDYPPIYTPILWSRLLARMPQRAAEPVERTHKDGIAVTPDSPEAFEEVLWMAFFPHLHDPAVSAVLDDRTTNPAFEAFYRDHIRKLLLARGGQRYLSKGNYNATRLEYLLKLFPDARFVIPVRDPAWHVASLMKQHALFSDGVGQSPQALRHLRRVGHFEFGPDRRPVNAGDRARIDAIARLWAEGTEADGWALYWSHIYGHIADRLDASPALRDAALIVRYEELCRAPRETLRAVLDHCCLAAPDTTVDRLASGIRYPTYYRPSFTEAEMDAIERHTRDTARRFGYADGPQEAVPAGPQHPVGDGSVPRTANDPGGSKLRPG